MLGTIVEITCQDRAAITSAFEEIKRLKQSPIFSILIPRYPALMPREKFRPAGTCLIWSESL